jgi:hypothetical protein
MCELHVAIHNRKFPDLHALFCLRDVNRSFVLPEDKAATRPKFLRRKYATAICALCPECSLHKQPPKIGSIKCLIYSLFYINVLESTPLQGELLKFIIVTNSGINV